MFVQIEFITQEPRDITLCEFSLASKLALTRKDSSARWGRNIESGRLQFLESYHVFSDDTGVLYDKKSGFYYKENPSEDRIYSYYVFKKEPIPEDFCFIENLQVVNLLQFASLWQGTPYKIVKSFNSDPRSQIPISEASALQMQILFEKIESKLTSLETALDKNIYINSRCDVHVPGNLLSTYNELLLADDCCTDLLQEHLNCGWRIVAICPQPDQRRPDYILGRWNPKLESAPSGAARNDEVIKSFERVEELVSGLSDSHKRKLKTLLTDEKI